MGQLAHIPTHISRHYGESSVHIWDKHSVHYAVILCMNFWTYERLLQFILPPVLSTCHDALISLVESVSTFDQSVMMIKKWWVTQWCKNYYNIACHCLNTLDFIEGFKHFWPIRKHQEDKQIIIYNNLNVRPKKKIVALE